MSGATSSVWLWLILVFAIFIKSSSAEQININAVFGETATLPCRVSDGNKAINTLEWSKPELETEYVFIYPDIKPDLAKQHQSFKNRVHLQDRRMRNGNVSLILKSVTNAHAGIYEVRVSPGAKHRKKAHLDGDPICIINLSVVDPPVQTKTAESGKDVTLPCQAPHNNIIGVKWSKADLGEEYVYLNRRGQPQPQGQHPSFKNWVDLQDRQMKDGDVSLTLKNVTRNNTGTYECLVFEEETGSWKSLSIIYLSVDPPGQTGGHTEDGGKEDRGKEDGPYALATGLPVTAVLLVVAIFGGLLIYTRYGKQKHQDTNELEKLDSSSSPSLDSLDNGSQTCKETAVVVLI